MHIAAEDLAALAFKSVDFSTVRPNGQKTAATGGSLTLLPGRVLHQPERDMRVVRKGEMNYAERDETVHLSQADADRAGIRQGDRVRVIAADGGTLVTGAARTDFPHEGYVAVTELFARIASAMQDSDDPDPSPTVPGLELRSVTLVKAPVREEAGVAAD